jgi:hypothetical protein
MVLSNMAFEIVLYDTIYQPTIGSLVEFVSINPYSSVDDHISCILCRS